jgi:hypothetical protein
MSHSRFACRALACWALLGGLVFAQQRTEVRTESARTALIVGAGVSLKGGTTVGKVEDVVIDEGGCIALIVVGYGERYIAIPWGIARFDFAERALVLDLDRERFADVPTFTDFRVALKADFRQRVDKFFGVRQGEGTGRRPMRSDDPPRPRTEDKSPRPKTESPRDPQDADPGRTPGKTQPKAKPPRDSLPGGKQPQGTQPGSKQPPRNAEPRNPGTKPSTPKGE